MNINSWILIDTLLLAFNFAYVVSFVFLKKTGIDTTAKATVFLLTILFIFPLGLMPVGILPLVDLLTIPRNWFWHYKIIFGLAFGDALTIILFLFAVLNFVLQKNIKKQILIAFICVIFIYFHGIFSAYFIASAVDFKNLQNATRSFLILVSFLCLGFSCADRQGLKLVDIVSNCLFVTLAISTISMLLLNSDFRAVRYWTSAILQSQQYVSVIPFLSIYFYVKRQEPGKNQRHFRSWILAGVGLLFFGYKAFYIIIIALIIFHLFSKQILNLGRFWGMTMFLLVILTQPLLLYFNFYFGGDGAIDTRLFQVLNSMKTLEESGLSAMLFGIGWGQWYALYFDFTSVDQGAWTLEQLFDDSRKHSIQLIPFSLVRSVGIVGLISALIVISLYLRKLCKKNTYIPKFEYLVFGMVLINLTTFLAIPDVLPESLAFSAFFVGVTMANMNYLKLIKTDEKN